MVYEDSHASVIILALVLHHDITLSIGSQVEFKCLRKLLGVSYRERKTNEFVRTSVNNLVGAQEPLLATVKRRKLTWYGHICRHDSLSKVILQGTVEGGRSRGRQQKSWSDNIKEWTRMSTPELLIRTADRDAWRRTSAASACELPDNRQGQGMSE